MYLCLDKRMVGNSKMENENNETERLFHLKHKKIKTHKHKLNLQNGSLLVMKGETQHQWFHQISKTKKRIGKRINLTFRLLK